jgi:NAD(P)-dependent dehydrogenase (short-subunit alcohol dehydrogenase family)
MAMGSLEGKVAWVAGGGEGFGRAVALALSARGARVLVTGPAERALGETVGEVVHGGGKARHLVVPPGDAAAANGAAERARELFGGLDVVVVAGPATVDDDATALRATLLDAHLAFDAAIAQMRSAGRLFAVRAFGRPPVAAAMLDAGLLGLVRAVAQTLEGRGITCNAVDVRGGADLDAAAARLVGLCGDAGDGITGELLPLA